MALPIIDKQNIRPPAWRVARLAQVQNVENPCQGNFQAVIIDIDGKRYHFAAAVPQAAFATPEIAGYNPEDLAWLSAWVEGAFTTYIQKTLEKLVRLKQLPGQFNGETFIPAHITALNPARMTRFFNHLSLADPWVSAQDLLNKLPELAGFSPETALALLRTALSSEPFYALGGDLWTTRELFDELNREVPRGLPVPHIRSKLTIWTEQDEQDLEEFHRKPLPAEAEDTLEELERGDTPPNPVEDDWHPLTGRVRLPTLNYLHITQAYFPVSHVIHAFPPNVHLVFVQFIEGNHSPFLLDRDNGLLKARDLDWLYTKIHEDEKGIPAGTYLWLEYQGGQKYRIAPQPLAAKKMVPCKLAYLDDKHQLYIEHNEYPMYYEGDPSIFKAEIRFSDIEALFAEAKLVNLSVRDTIIFAIQELCKADPNGRAYWRDIFNTVFLKRMCSPNSVSILLYTQPCFEQLGDGFFRYRADPTLKSVTRKPHTRKMKRHGKPKLSSKQRTSFRFNPAVLHPQTRHLTGFTTPEPELEPEAPAPQPESGPEIEPLGSTSELEPMSEPAGVKSEPEPEPFGTPSEPEPLPEPVELQPGPAPELVEPPSELEPLPEPVKLQLEPVRTSSVTMPLPEPVELEPVSELVEIPSETEPMLELLELQPERIPEPEPAETPSEPEPITEAVELQTELESGPEPVEIPSETEPMPEPVELEPERIPEPELAETPSELEPITEPVELQPEPESWPEPIGIPSEPEPMPETVELQPEPEPMPELVELQPEPEPEFEPVEIPSEPERMLEPFELQPEQELMPEPTLPRPILQQVAEPHMPVPHSKPRSLTHWIWVSIKYRINIFWSFLRRSHDRK